LVKLNKQLIGCCRCGCGGLGTNAGLSAWLGRFCMLPVFCSMDSLDAAIAAQHEAIFGSCMFFLSSQFTSFCRTSHRKNILEKGKGTNIRQDSINSIVLRGCEDTGLIVPCTQGCLHSNRWIHGPTKNLPDEGQQRSKGWENMIQIPGWLLVKHLKACLCINCVGNNHIDLAQKALLVDFCIWRAVIV
jgi:hypothetical protein